MVHFVCLPCCFLGSRLRPPLRSGAVPPFGSLWPGVLTVMDRSLEGQGLSMNFNAGLRTLSVLGLRVAQYVEVEAPVVADFAS